MWEAGSIPTMSHLLCAIICESLTIFLSDVSLDLFFSRQNVGDLFHIVFHLPRLYTRLTQVPSKRPHPALMYAMVS